MEQPERVKIIVADIDRGGVIAIIRATEQAGVVEAGCAIARGGVTALEVTLTTPGACTLIQELRSRLPANVRVGAGTILNAAAVNRAVDSGAEFIVTPTVQIESILASHERGVPIACGAYTPTEALAVYNAGADYVKLFPAEVLGVPYIRAILAPLPFLRIVPTGGVSVANCADFINAGCPAVAIGTGLVNSETLRSRDWCGLEERARELVRTIQAAREKYS